MLEDADRAAARALAEVDATAATQLRVLKALRAVLDACPEDGFLRGEVARFLVDRQQAFVRFHERRLQSPDPDGDEAALAAAWDEAIAFTVGVVGDGEAAAALRARKRAALAAGRPPRPFFARFLDRQER